MTNEEVSVVVEGGGSKLKGWVCVKQV